ncbi:MAG: hypothetical protein ACTHMS_17745, partial [Jatrophihabitans sp.]|uniref:hypothetical protein n=1 Tax=Jatrophihabitans sp. TaxID=1932789 RepID=UPI003F7F5619
MPQGGGFRYEIAYDDRVWLRVPRGDERLGKRWAKDAGEAWGKDLGAPRRWRATLAAMLAAIARQSYGDEPEALFVHLLPRIDAAPDPLLVLLRSVPAGGRAPGAGGGVLAGGPQRRARIARARPDPGHGAPRQGQDVRGRPDP